MRNLSFRLAGAILFLLGISFFNFAQDTRDLIRFSETQVFGSARFEAMGGAFGALGADLSSSSINPAGFGRYSSSTFGLAFQNTIILNKATFNNEETQKSLNSFKLNNLGFVLTSDVSENNKGFLFFQFGFSFNRLQNFKDSYSYSGQQFSSLLDEFCSFADQVSPDYIYDVLPFSSALAWDTYAINENGSGGFVPDLNYSDVKQRRNIKNSGGVSEYNFNLSANYMNKLYIGGNIGLKTAKYFEDYYHYEQATNTEGVELDSFEYEYHLKTKGNGANLKLGIIYLPIQNLRLGLSLHTPTFFNLSDDFSADMTSYFKDTTRTVADELKPVGNYKYRLRTPTKLVGSLAYIFGTRGCINADIEVVDYKFAHFKTTADSSYTPYSYKVENENAKNELRTVVNLRLGGEIVFNSQYFIRAGFALYPSGYSKILNPVKGTQIFSGGIGFKWKNKSIDLALKVEHRNFNYIAFENSITVINSFRNGIVFNYSVSF